MPHIVSLLLSVCESKICVSIVGTDEVLDAFSGLPQNRRIQRSQRWWPLNSSSIHRMTTSQMRRQSGSLATTKSSFGNSRSMISLHNTKTKNGNSVSFYKFAHDIKICRWCQARTVFCWHDFTGTYLSAGFCPVIMSCILLNQVGHSRTASDCWPAAVYATIAEGDILLWKLHIRCLICMVKLCSLTVCFLYDIQVQKALCGENWRQQH